MAEKIKTKRMRWFLLVGGALLALLFTYTLYVSFIQYQSSLYNPESARLIGCKALSMLLTEAGFTEAKQDSSEQTGVYVVLTKGLNPVLRENCLQRAEAGGVIVELPSGQPMIAPDQETNLVIGVRGRECVPQSSDLKELGYHVGSNMVYRADRPETGILSVDGYYFVYSQAYGKGTILTWADPAGLTNGKLKEYPDNAVIFTLLLQNIAADDTVLAFVDGRNLQGGAVPAAAEEEEKTVISRWDAYLLLLLGLGLTFWKMAARLGRPRPLVPTDNRSYDEFVRSLASLFQQAKAGRIVLDNLYRALQETACEITGLSAETPQEELFGRLAEMTGRDFGGVLGIYQSLQNSGHILRAGRMLKMALKLETIRKELEQWKKSGIYSLK